jgi:predicted metalloendopeptidase
VAENTVRIVRDGLEARVYSPFEAKEAIKTLPKRWRRWDTEEKCWVVVAYAIEDLKRALRAEGFTVMERTADGAKAEPPRSRRGAETWADAMFAALGKPLGDKAFKALVPVLHPDRGGSLEAMQALNAARDRAAVA